jgi:hypothetical protein
LTAEIIQNAQLKKFEEIDKRVEKLEGKDGSKVD